MASVQEVNSTFALDLLRVVGKDRTKNVFFSPMSISSAMAMVYLGAKGNTAAQMAKVGAAAVLGLAGAWGTEREGGERPPPHPLLTRRLPAGRLSCCLFFSRCPGPPFSCPGRAEILGPLSGPVLQQPQGSGPPSLLPATSPSPAALEAPVLRSQDTAGGSARPPLGDASVGTHSPPQGGVVTPRLCGGAVAQDGAG